MLSTNVKRSDFQKPFTFANVTQPELAQTQTCFGLKITPLVSTTAPPAYAWRDCVLLLLVLFDTIYFPLLTFLFLTFFYLVPNAVRPMLTNLVNPKNLSVYQQCLHFKYLRNCTTS